VTGRLQQKVAIVTGATAGIGAATARRLAAEGALVVLSGRSAERATPLAAEIDAPFVQADLTVDETPERLVGAAIERFGRLDILVNNAANDHTGDLLSTSMDEVRPLFEVNFFAALRMLQAAGRAMSRQGGGAIVNVTSRLPQSAYRP
jgi:NAD(P)-dependent dehydrogenase (short-subunit alcohol dehydrogenase family)